jgi:hypothetical protein
MWILADLTKNILYVNNKEYKISCVVRTILEGTRQSYEVIKSIPQLYPVDPRPFPKGVWKITGVDWQAKSKFDINTYGTVKIKTDASQKLPIWTLDSEGDYKSVTTDTTIDTCYWLHYSKSNTTLGCIRLDSIQDAEEIAHFVEDVLKTGEPVELEVV